MRVVSAEQIRSLDRRAMDESGIPGVVLMENAGRAVVDLLERRYGPLRGKRAAVFCGAGNNGGDGFVIFRLLLLAGADVTLFTTMTDPASAVLKPDAAAHYKAIRTDAASRAGVIPTACAGDPAWARRFDIAVDALLGTGIKSAPHGRYADAILAMNGLECPVISVDIPSGVDADTGSVPGDAVRANQTVTFAYPKLGLLLFPGAEHAGQITVSDIGFNWSSLEPDTHISLVGCARGFLTGGVEFSPSLAEPAGWEKLLQKRRPETNKGDYGHVGILAGSRGMVGAPAMVARAAQRSGAGLVTVFTPQSAQTVLATKLDEQMTVPLPETDGSASEQSYAALAAFAERAAVFCIGPGLTTNDETVRLVLRMLRELPIPVVLDADGLNALALYPEAAVDRHMNSLGPLILTPHPGEAARLLGTSIAQVQSDRIASARELARRYRAVAVLKGRYTLIADMDENVQINMTGNAGMATGGMGDTLTGVIGALVGQNAERKKRPGMEVVPWSGAAALGVHAHGFAGDLAALELGEVGLTASDVIERIPLALSRLIQPD